VSLGTRSPAMGEAAGGLDAPPRAASLGVRSLAAGEAPTLFVAALIPFCATAVYRVIALGLGVWTGGCDGPRFT
jgi:hypothetical protein